MLMIRLARFGAKKKPFYRVVVIEKGVNEPPQERQTGRPSFALERSVNEVVEP